MKRLKARFSSWKDVLVEREFHAIVVLMTTTRRTKKNQKKRDEDCRQWGEHSDYLVHVHEIIREQQDSCLYFVMEHMAGGSLHDYIVEKSKWNSSLSSRSPVLTRNCKTKHDRAFDDSETRSILFQVFRGLCHIHSLGIAHRDIKPENILLDGKTAKLADFSLARPILLEKGNRCCQTGGESCASFCYAGNHSCQNTVENCSDGAGMATNYIGTRWYRAPELLRPDSTITDTGNGDNDDDLNDYNNHRGFWYTKAIDVFSMGCVAAELYSCHPLFWGKDEKEQLKLIKELLLVTRPPFEGENIAHEVFSEKDDKQRKERIVKNRLENVIPTTDPLDITFLYDILQICPKQRATTEEVLCHAYFEREYKATSMRNENEESPRLKSITRTKAKRRSSVLALPKSTMIPSSNKTPIGEPRKQLSPSAAPRTGNTTIRIHPSRSVRITPAAVDSMDQKGICRFYQNANERMSPVHKTSDFFEYRENADHPIWGNDEGSKVAMIPSPSLKRKRQKLRPSQIFNID